MKTAALSRCPVGQPASTVDDGTLVVHADGSFVYTPLPTDLSARTTTFTYTVKDPGGLASPSRTITINILANTPPVADAKTVNMAEDTVHTGQLSGSDPENASITYKLDVGAFHGLVSVLPNGTFTYTPEKDYFGDDSFTFKVNDGVQDSATSASVSIKIANVNDAPVIMDYMNMAIDEGFELAGTYTATDVDGDVLTYSVTMDTAGGPGFVIYNSRDGDTRPVGDYSALIPFDEATGAAIWVPQDPYNGPFTFTVCVSDGLLSACDSFTVTVNPINDAPVVSDQSTTIDEDSSATFTLTATDPDSTSFTYEIVDAPSLGTVSIDGNKLSYVASPDKNGSDTFTYKANDGFLDSAVAEITVNITPVNDAPWLPSYGTFNLRENEETVYQILGGDVDGDTVTYSTVGAPTGLVLDPVTGLGSWTPGDLQVGTFVFEVCASDGKLTTCTPITLTVANVNDAPVASHTSASTAEDTAVTFTLPGSDIDSTQLTYSVVTGDGKGPLHGTVVINGNQATYTPNLNYNGSDSFEFHVFDQELYSDPAVVTITITAVNDAPVLPTFSTVSGQENELITLVVPATDVDTDAADLVYTLSGDVPAGATIALNAENKGYFTWTPADDQTGDFNFNICVTDGLSEAVCTPVKISVAPVNDAPVAQGATVSTLEDTPLDVNLVATDIDNNVMELSYKVHTNPTNGSVVIVGNVATYTPNANTNGSDSFTYVANDGNLDSAPATVSITIDPANDAPTAESFAVTAYEDTPKTFSLQGDDIDGDALTYEIVAAPQFGTIVLTGGSAEYSPAPDYFGADSLTYIAKDSSLNSEVATVTLDVKAINDAPDFAIAGDQVSNEDQGSVTVLNFATALDLGAENEATQGGAYILEMAEADMALFSALPTVGVGGTLRYTSAPDANGIATVIIKFVDNGGTDFGGQNTSPVKTFTITVNRVNDQPSFKSGPDITINEDESYTSDPDAWATEILAGSDIEQTSQTVWFEITASDAPDVLPIGNVNITPAGVLSFAPLPNKFGQVHITIVLKDDGGTDNSGIDTSIEHVLTINITSVNDLPIAPNATAVTDEDNAVDITVVATDVDTHHLMYSVVTPPANGTATFVENVVTYTPDLDFFGTDTFTYLANDHYGDSNVATITVTVNAVADYPQVHDMERTILEDQSVTVDIMSEDVDTPAADLVYSISVQPSNGTALPDPADPTKITYTPAADFFGVDSFTYTVDDGRTSPDVPASATVTIYVTSVPDAPVIALDPNASPASSYLEDPVEPITFTMLATDGDGDALTFSANLAAEQLGVHINETTGVVTWTPPVNSNGSFEFEFCASDGMYTDCMTVTIVIDPVDDDPVAKYGQADGPEDTLLPFRLEGTDVENDKLFFEIENWPDCQSVTDPDLKCDLTLTNISTGEGTFMPPLNFNGTITFTFRVGDETNDGSGTHWGTSASFDLIINPVNDPPFIDVFTVPAVDEDPTDPITFTIPGSDPDSTDTVTYYLSLNAMELGMIAAPDTGVVTWMPAENLFGNFDIQVCVSDDGHMLGYEGEPGFPEHHFCRDITITINPVNDLPVAQDISVTTDEDVAVEITLLATDVDDETLTFEVLTQDNPGSPVVNGNKLNFTPEPHWNGTVKLTYVANDGKGNSNTATVTIVINPVDNAPFFLDPGTLTGNETKSLTIQFTADDVDTPVEDLVFSLGNGAEPGMSITPTGLFTWTPSTTGPITVNVCVTDSVSTTCKDFVIQIIGRPVAHDQIVIAVTLDPVTNQLTGESFVGGNLVFEQDPNHLPKFGQITSWDSATGIVVYQPTIQYFYAYKQAGYAYVDSFGFTVTDTEGSVSLPATVGLSKQMQLYFPIITK